MNQPSCPDDPDPSTVSAAGPTTDQQVASHYGTSGLLSSLLDAMLAAGLTPSELTVNDLAPLDAFHTGGRSATIELAEKGVIDSTHRVLDLGCGIGGSSRFLAQQFGCRVCGLDLTPEYIDAAKALTSLVSLNELVQFQQGSATALPFPDQSFDVAWTEHVQMNISDKRLFYSEILRVLKPGGRLLFHDVFRGVGSEPIYPTPWAQDGSFSFLVSELAARQTMADLGFQTIHWENRNAQSIEFFEKTLAHIEANGPPPLGLHLLMGKNAKEKIRNYAENLVKQRVGVAMGVQQAPV